jgi:hypothetical protein
MAANGTRMPEEQLHPILRHLQRHLPGAGSRELSDRQLLERFAHHKDPCASPSRNPIKAPSGLVWRSTM